MAKGWADSPAQRKRPLKLGSRTIEYRPTHKPTIGLSTGDFAHGWGRVANDMMRDDGSYDPLHRMQGVRVRISLPPPIKLPINWYFIAVESLNC